MRSRRRESRSSQGSPDTVRRADTRPGDRLQAGQPGRIGGVQGRGPVHQRRRQRRHREGHPGGDALDRGRRDRSQWYADAGAGDQLDACSPHRYRGRLRRKPVHRGPGHPGRAQQRDREGYPVWDAVDLRRRARASGEPTPGPATDSMLNYPQGVAVDGAGNVYIADTGNGVVEKVNTEGILSIYASSYFPQGVAASASGEVYVTGNGNTVDKVEPAGQLSRIAGTGQAGEPTPGPATRSMLDRPNAGGRRLRRERVHLRSGQRHGREGDARRRIVDHLGRGRSDPRLDVDGGARRVGVGHGDELPVGDHMPRNVLRRLRTRYAGDVDSDPEARLGVCRLGRLGVLGHRHLPGHMGSDMAVTATFQQLPPVTLTVALAGSGSGSVESSPSGIACPGTCSYAYPPGTPVTLTPTAGVGLTVCWLGRLGVLGHRHLPSHAELRHRGHRHVRKAPGPERLARWLGLGTVS